MFARTAAVAAVIAFSSSWLLLADEPVFSGPQVGESLVPFQVLAVGGPQAGTKIDPIARAEGKPTLLVFVHKLTRPGVSLARGLTSYAAAQEGVATGIIWLDDDQAAAEDYLKRAWNSLNFAAPVGISVDGGEGPGAYGLNRNVELTILVAKSNEVTANFALVQPSVTEAPKIAGELAKLINQPAPTSEQLAKFVSPRGGDMQRPMQRADSGERGSADRGETDLRTLMRGLISSQDKEENLAAAVKAIETWVGEKPDRKAQLQRMAGAVLERGLGSEKVQAQLKQWQAKQE